MKKRKEQILIIGLGQFGMALSQMCTINGIYPIVWMVGNNVPEVFHGDIQES